MSAIEIWTYDDFNSIRNNLSGEYIQMADISLKTAGTTPGWLPIGTIEAPFTGNYNGNGCEIAYFTIRRDVTACNGIFGACNNAVIENLNVIGSISTTNIYSGLLIGHCINTIINNCKSDGVNGLRSEGGIAGGLIGYANNSEILNCKVFARVYNDTSQILPDTYGWGGLVGVIENNCYIYNCRFFNEVTGGEAVGGLIGVIDNSTVENSYRDHNVGIENLPTIAASNANYFDYGTGGFAGRIINNSIVKNCYSATRVNRGYYIGAFAGEIINSEIENCYAVGDIISGTNKGAFAGISIDSDVINCFYNSDISNLFDNDIATPLTTEEMKISTNFTNWDFNNIWEYNIDACVLPVLISGNKGKKHIFQYGNGTSGSPYQVWTAEDLNGVRNYLHSHFIQMANIDLFGYNWIPIGHGTADWIKRNHKEITYMDITIPYFNGVYNGNNFTISNIHIKPKMMLGTERFGGLFSEGNTNSILKNIKINNLLFEKRETIYNTEVGSLVGMMYGKIENCHSKNINIIGEIRIGGMIGLLLGNETSFNNTVDNFEVSGYWEVGGLVGSSINENNITKSYASNGKVILNAMELTPGWWWQRTCALGGFAGGLEGRVEECGTFNVELEIIDYWEVIATFYIGGLTGIIYYESNFKNCFTIGNINVYASKDWFNAISLTGIVGCQYYGGGNSFIENCYTCQDINIDFGPDVDFSLVDEYGDYPWSFLHIANFVGVVSTGLTGHDFVLVNSINSYYNIDKNHFNLYPTTNDNVGEGMTTEDMIFPHNENTIYIDWDFDIVWAISGQINDGYPTFQFLIPNFLAYDLHFTIKDRINNLLPSVRVFVTGENIKLTNAFGQTTFNEILPSRRKYYSVFLKGYQPIEEQINF